MNQLTKAASQFDAIDAATAGMPRRPTRQLDHLPGDYGWPVIGYTADFFRNMPALTLRMEQQYGPVFRSSVLFDRGVNLIGADAARFVLMDQERNFSSRLPWSSLLEGLFTNGLMLRDFENHRLHRRILQEAFKKPMLEIYTGQMNSMLQSGIDNWPQQQYFDFFTHVKALLLNTATRIFLGAELGSEANTLNRAFVHLLDASMAVIRLPLPGTSWRRGLQGRKVLEQYLAATIAARRQHPGQDFFSSLCQASDEDGRKFSDQDIIDHMIFLLFAAHDTTTSTLSSAINLLCQHPEWQQALREEMLAVETCDLSFDQIAGLPLTDQVFKEVLRMYPPVPVIPRRTIRECEFAGFRLPANCGVAVHTHHTHYMEQYWTHPHVFDPARWSPERAEHKQHSFQWLPFGGGAHKCLGLNFAEIQTKVFLFQLLRRYRFQLQPGHVTRYKFVPMEVPGNGLPVQLSAL